MVKLKDILVDKYLTWRTGKSKAQREWEAWYEANVVYRASTVDNMFMHFKHVIEVDIKKFMDPHEPFVWVPNSDAKQYFWPQRVLGNNAVWRFERLYWNQWEQRWYINDMGDTEKVFVATNNERDAIMIALKYSS